MKTLAIFSATLLAGAAAPPPQQFDLVCTGELASLSLAGTSTSAYKRVLRIDLKAGRWCADACATVDRIAGVEPGQILLRNDKRDAPREYWVEREGVDRVTGEHSSMAFNDPNGPNPRSAFRKGHCDPAPFSGFLNGMAKF